MHSHAQTNIQLFNQLHRERYGAGDLAAVASAYELTATLMTGQFRASGKTFIAHLVGTASILASLHAASPMVVAALLHAVYSAGDFGDDRLGISDTKRERIRLAIGEQAEGYVCRYHELAWSDQTIRRLSGNLDAIPAIERDVVVMRLANELEDHLDLGMLYCGEQKRTWSSGSERCRLMVDIARRLGFPKLADELQQAIEETAVAVIPSELLRPSARNASFVLAPESCQRLKYLLAARLASLRQGPAKPTG